MKRIASVIASILVLGALSIVGFQLSAVSFPGMSAES
jgi:hypothetical protein